MEIGQFSKDFLKSPSAFSVFLNFQQTLKPLCALYTKKIPKKSTQVKELKRKQRLKSLYLDYLQILNLTPDPAAQIKTPFELSETQLKSLLQHQTGFISDLQPASPRPAKPSAPSSSIYRNPLIFKIKTVLEPESKLFRPTNNNFLVKSLFFHEETEALTHKMKLATLLNTQLAKLPVSKIRSLVNKQKKIDGCYRVAYEKIEKGLCEAGVVKRKGSLDKSILINLSSIFTPKSTRSQNCSEDLQEASTSRSSSASYRRLGFFKV